MPAVRVRGRALPDGEFVDLCSDGDRWTTDPARDAVVIEGWLLPGLVDAHTHPGAAKPGDPLDHELLRSDLEQHVASGVTLIRCPGLAGEPPDWFGADSALPRGSHAGPWIAQHGQFFDGWGRRASHDDLPRVAAEQASRTGWAKLIADWGVDHEAVPASVLTAVVAAVHAVGGRVAVHSQQSDGGAAAVAARVDSIEHGMCLDPALLPQMASQGTALTPTLAVILGSIERMRQAEDARRRQWFLEGASAHGALAVAAAEAGVTLLAGSDSRPHGRIANEVHALASAGVPPHVALGAASWTARDYLGLPGLVEGAPADAVVYASDPRTDLTQLDHPIAVVLRGALVLRA